MDARPSHADAKPSASYRDKSGICNLWPTPFWRHGRGAIYCARPLLTGRVALRRDLRQHHLDLEEPQGGASRPRRAAALSNCSAPFTTARAPDTFHCACGGSNTTTSFPSASRRPSGPH